MEALVACLQATLSPDGNIRNAAEAHLKDALGRQGTASILTQLALSDQWDLPTRQICIALKQLVKLHWSPFFESFQGPIATPLEEKYQVRPALLQSGLACPSRQIRNILAAVVSEIAHADFPDEWPDLTHALLHLLSSGNADAVHGSLRVLADFCKSDLTEDQLIPLASELLPKLLLVLQTDSQFSAVSRARTLAIFNQSVFSLFMVKEQFPAAVEQAITAFLPQWLSTIHQLLNTDVLIDANESSDRWDNLAVRHEAFRALDTILSSFPQVLRNEGAEWLRISLQHLVALADAFRTHVTAADADGGSQLSEEASDVSADLSRLIGQVIDGVQHLSRKPWAKQLFVDQAQPKAELASVLQPAIYYAQVTADDEENWQDANAFVTDQDDEGIAASLRMASLDLVQTMLEMFPSPTILALSQAAFTSLEQAKQLRARSESDWWKGFEAVLFAVGAVSEDILDHNQQKLDQQQPPEFDLLPLFDAAVMPFFHARDTPYLQGRAFVFASQFITALPESAGADFLSQALSAIAHEETSIPVKLSAIRGIVNCLRSLPSDTTRPFARQALLQFLPVLNQTSSSTLVLLLEAIEAVLRSGIDTLSSEDVAHVVRAVFAIWQQEIADPSVSLAASELLSAIACGQSPAAQTSLEADVLPFLAAALQANEKSHIPAAAVDVLDSVLNAAQSPLPANAFQNVAPNLLPLLAATDDRSIIQSGLDILVQFSRKAWSQVQQWHDGSGKGGLEAIFQVIARVLGPDQSESGGLFVGDLIVHVLRQAGNSALSVIPDLLRALLVRLATAQTASFSQSLIMPFALLLHTQTEAVLDLLEQFGTLPEASEPALFLLLRCWCDNVETIQGFWSNRVSSLALAKVLLSQRASLHDLSVKGNMIVDPSEGILTRSRSKTRPVRYEEIPFQAKALRVLALDLIQEEQSALMNVAPEDVASDDGDDDWEEDEATTQANVLDSLGIKGLPGILNDKGDDLEAAEDEDEFADDPISQMDFRAALRECLQHFVQQTGEQRTNQLASYLSAEEQRALHQTMMER